MPLLLLALAVDEPLAPPVPLALDEPPVPLLATLDAPPVPPLELAPEPTAATELAASVDEPEPHAVRTSVPTNESIPMNPRVRTVIRTSGGDAGQSIHTPT